jgi:spore coat polysaccharide biosynthesis protein SpsF (cytidylyltransferase family)
LVKRLIPTGLPIYIAVPDKQMPKYAFLMERFPDQVFISSGYDKDPLARMYHCAKQNGIDTIVRVTHDKIFVDSNVITSMVETIKKYGNDYVYSSNFVPGTGAEVISFSALETAAKKYKNIEHISYAIKSITKKVVNYNFTAIDNHESYRLLVDYPEDVKLMDIIFSTLGSDCSLKDVIQFMSENSWVRNINKMPLVTIYTCAYNAEKWINEAMGSVSFQDVFKKSEYIIIDDYSSDKTLFNIGKFCHTHKRARMYKNSKNEGLATSSNRALKLAKGKYIIRLDADDYFTDKEALSKMIDKMERESLDIIYPDCYLSDKPSEPKIQKGNENFHAGCALFKTSALNYIKFTDKLRGFDSLDLYARAREILKIGFLEQPMFLYRQHSESMSKNNLQYRENIRKKIYDKHKI